MDKKTRILAIIAALAASILIITSPSGSIVIPKPNSSSTTGNDAVQVIATNLQKPWALTFGDGKIFFTEKIGKLRVIDNGILVNDSVADFHVV